MKFPAIWWQRVGSNFLKVRIPACPRVCTYVPRAEFRTDSTVPARHQRAGPAADHGGSADGTVHARSGPGSDRETDCPGPRPLRGTAENRQLALLRLE